MERLTDNSSYCTSWTDCPATESRCKVKENCYDRKMYEKLRFYEDLEEHLEKVYGEHDGLLETVIKSLVKYNGEKPRKSRLLTDEDADKWEMYKDAEEQGLLIRLPYPLGTELYFPFKCKGVIKDRIRRWQINKNGLCFCSYAGNAYRPEVIGKTVFPTREEAEAALAEMNKKENINE